MKPPRIAYVILWFPEASETFIFHEVDRLWKMGVPLTVFTLYGRYPRSISPVMANFQGRVERMGIPYLLEAHRDLMFWLKKSPRMVRRLFRTIPLRRWCDLEAAGENCWAFLCGFHLARRFEEEGIEHIHAPWANGPATAAWVASKLTGIPFSFAAHAGDIYPPDGALREKIRDCAFIRSENLANVGHLIRFASGETQKIHMIHSGHPPQHRPEAKVLMTPPLQVLALGRFVPKKGFDVLIRACKILDDLGVDFRLTLGGSGPCGKQLQALRRIFAMEGKISFPGFIRYDRVSQFLDSGDIFVMPSVVDPTSDRDGIPNVIVEALLHRVPVVATDVCGIGEVIRDGETGLLVPEKDPFALAKAVLKLIDDRKSALEMAEKGRSLVLQEFDLDRSCLAMLRLFREHLERTAAP